ncbi:pyridoxal phosphate-dependent aminotransferase [Candidatus Dependentiae bacterium]|nr:pyridoxal phosphate-dependent aminotransferase [Candidatus Dependentiae bacterium]
MPSKLNYISKKIKKQLTHSSWIRKMFETGNELKIKYGAENVFDFSLGNPDAPPPDAFFDCYSKLCCERKPENHSYMPNAGYPDTRNKLASRLSEIYDKKISINNLIMTSGAAGAINIALKSILNKRDEVILIAPYFAEYIFYVDNHGGIIEIADSTSDFDIDIKNIEKSISDKTSAIIINSPNNPTGKVYSESNLVQLADLLRKYSEKFGRPIYIISDEPYRNIIYDDRKIPSMLNIYQNTIIVNSYSKELSLPGERLGYALINPDCEGKLELFDAMVMCNRILGFVNASATMQRVIGNLIYEYSVQVDKFLYERRRNILYDFLTSAGYEIYKTEGAFYLFVKSPIEDDVKFKDILLSENILAVPGTGFGRSGYFRLAYCVSEKTIFGSFPGFKRAIEKVK